MMASNSSGRRTATYRAACFTASRRPGAVVAALIQRPRACATSRENKPASPRVAVLAAPVQRPGAGVPRTCRGRIPGRCADWRSRSANPRPASAPHLTGARWDRHRAGSVARDAATRSRAMHCLGQFAGGQKLQCFGVVRLDFQPAQHTCSANVRSPRCNWLRASSRQAAAVSRGDLSVGRSTMVRWVNSGVTRSREAVRYR